MLREGAFADPKPAAVYGLHAFPELAAGQLGVAAGPAMAASDRFEIRVRGRQTHAAMPWAGVDPIPIAARILLAIEAIPARELDVRSPAIVSVGAIHGGVRHNILPDEVELLGTIRTFTPEAQERAHRRVREIAEKTAEAGGASAEVKLATGYPVTVNDPAETARVRAVLARVAGEENVVEVLPHTGAEDFSFFAREAPGVFFRLGVRDPATQPGEAAPNHSPRFLVDERALVLGVRALAHAALEHNSRR
jgi:amidohydrolase